MHTCIHGMARTTVALSPATRDRLLVLKRQWRLPTTEAVILRMLEGQPSGAKALYARNKKAVDAVLRRHGMRRLVAFGSRARGDARPDSDLDLVGRLPRGADLVDLAHIQEELSEAFGVRVDLVSEGGLRGRLREQVQRDGVMLAA
jgi:predicted nucleotidyltransferase